MTFLLGVVFVLTIIPGVVWLFLILATGWGALRAATGFPHLRRLTLVTVCMQTVLAVVRICGATVGTVRYGEDATRVLDPRWESALLILAAMAPLCALVHLIITKKERSLLPGPIMQLGLTLCLVCYIPFLITGSRETPGPATSPDGKWQVWMMPVFKLADIDGPIFVHRFGERPWWHPIENGHRSLSVVKTWRWVPTQSGQGLRLLAEAYGSEGEMGTVAFGSEKAAYTPYKERVRLNH